MGAGPGTALVCRAGEPPQVQGRGEPSGAGPGTTLVCRAGEPPWVQGRGDPGRRQVLI